MATPRWKIGWAAALQELGKSTVPSCSLGWACPAPAVDNESPSTSPAIDAYRFIVSSMPPASPQAYRTGTTLATSAIRREPGTNEVLVEAEELRETHLLHDREAGAIDPADTAIAIPDEEVPGAAPALRCRFDQRAKSARLDRLAQRHRVVDRTARFQERDGLPHDPLGRHEANAVRLQPAKYGARPPVILIAPVAQRHPASGVDEDCAECAHLRRRDRRGAP